MCSFQKRNHFVTFGMYYQRMLFLKLRPKTNLQTHNDYGTMTIVMKNIKISKSQFKPKALEYFRMVEEEKQTFIITHNGNPVAQITPFQDDDDSILSELSGTVLEFKSPTEPVGMESWEVLK